MFETFNKKFRHRPRKQYQKVSLSNYLRIMLMPLIFYRLFVGFQRWNFNPLAQKAQFSVGFEPDAMCEPPRSSSGASFSFLSSPPALGNAADLCLLKSRDNCLNYLYDGVWGACSPPLTCGSGICPPGPGLYCPVQRLVPLACGSQTVPHQTPIHVRRVHTHTRVHSLILPLLSDAYFPTGTTS